VGPPPVKQSAPHPPGADAKRMGRQPQIHANPLQGLSIVVLSVFNGLYGFRMIDSVGTYRKLSGLRIGLLINFNVVLVKQAIKRLVL